VGDCASFLSALNQIGMATLNHTFMPRVLNNALFDLDFSVRQVELWENS
jgi:hypothetical protein